MRDLAPRSTTLGALFDGLHVAQGVDDWAMLRISGLSLDSRQIAPGDLYLALPGRVSHGLDHARDALARGAIAIATPAPLDAAPAWRGGAGEVVLPDVAAQLPLLVVEGLEAAVATLAGRFFDAPDRALRLVAVTGTDGKTSVCRFVAGAFAQLGESAGYIGTLGWGLVGIAASNDGLDRTLDRTALTTPDAVALRRMLRALLDAGAGTVTLEASSHGLAEGRLAGLAIDVAVLTNLGRDHLDYHVDEQAYADAKTSLFDWPGLRGRVLNADDRLGRALVQRGSGAAAAFRFDAHDLAPVPGLMYEHRLSQLHAHADGLRFRIEEIGTDGCTRTGTVDSGLFGRFNAQNLAACFGVLRLCDVPFDAALGALGSATPVAGRMQRVTAETADSGSRNAAAGALPTVIVDYAHTPGALAAAIDAARAHCDGDLCVVFGCGGDRDPGKRAPMARAARVADRIVVTDDNPRTEASEVIIAMIREGFEADDPVTVIADRRVAIERSLAAASATDVVLVAGKGHEDYQIVGEQRLEFSDRAIASAALARRAAGLSVRAGEQA